MAARIQLALAAALGLVALALAGVLLLGSGDDAAGEGPQLSSMGFAGAVRPDIPPQDFRLTDQDGRPATLAEHRGEVVVLTFLYTTCEDTCPVATSQIRGALDQLGEDVPVLAVSVDPANDTARTAKRFVLEQRMTGRMRFLLGDRDELEPVWEAYGVRPQGEGFEHSAHVLVIDRRGRQRIGFPVAQLTPEGLAHDVRKLLDEPA